MPLQLSPIDPAIQALLARGVYTHLHSDQQHEGAPLHRRLPEEVLITNPFPVCILPAALPLDLAQAVNIGWQSLLLHHDEAFALAEVHRGTEENSEPAFARLAIGGLVPQVWTAMTIANSWPGSEQANFELRMLYIHEIYASFLWLYGEENFFIPLQENHELNLQNIYPEEELLRMLNEAVQDYINRVKNGAYDDEG